MMFAALANTVPLSFWLICNIFADEHLLSQIRLELDKCITQIGKKATINATKLKRECPLLLSTTRETLRTAAYLNVNRFVLEDTTLSNSSTGESYTVKKGSMVQIATSVIHNQTSAYGETALRFDPRRFMTNEEKAGGSEDGQYEDKNTADISRPTSLGSKRNAFRPFGGGYNLCPGRHFAQTEIMALAALFVAGFEIRDGKTGGAFLPPPREGLKVLQGVIKPKCDVEVSIRRREGFESVEWTFEV